jgi:hypothetical protein
METSLYQEVCHHLDMGIHLKPHQMSPMQYKWYHGHLAPIGALHTKNKKELQLYDSSPNEPAHQTHISKSH